MESQRPSPPNGINIKSKFFPTIGFFLSSRQPQKRCTFLGLSAEWLALTFHEVPFTFDGSNDVCYFHIFRLGTCPKPLNYR